MDNVDTIEDLIVSALKAQPDTGFYAEATGGVLEIFDSDDCLVFSGDMEDQQALWYEWCRFCHEHYTEYKIVPF